jgi:hypothetical protein
MIFDAFPEIKTEMVATLYARLIEKNGASLKSINIEGL